MVATVVDESESGVLLIPLQLEQQQTQRLSTKGPLLRKLEIDEVVAGLDEVREVMQAAGGEVEYLHAGKAVVEEVYAAVKNNVVDLKYDKSAYIVQVFAAAAAADSAVVDSAAAVVADIDWDTAAGVNAAGIVAVSAAVRIVAVSAAV